MRILVLGGTQFLGRAIAAHAVAAGHDVTCAARGITGATPPGAHLVPIDRESPNGLAPLDGETWDAVIDIGRHPGQVRRAVAALKPVSVYADNSIPNQTPATATMLAPSPPEVEHSTSGELRPHQGRLRTGGRPGRLPLPPRPHRRPRGPHRPLPLLAAPPVERRRSPRRCRAG